MAKWFKNLFGASGDKTTVPDTTDPSGYVSYQSGFPADYQRSYPTDPLAKTVDRQTINQLFYDVTGALQQYQTHGFPDYIDATTNGGTAYAYGLNAIVRFTDGLNYRNTVVDNTNAPNVSGWVLYNDPSSAINAATAKTTPIGADKIGIWDSVTETLKSVTFTNLWESLTSLFAPINSPAFTGTPTAPTATAGTNTTQLATTEFTAAHFDSKLRGYQTDGLHAVINNLNTAILNGTYNYNGDTAVGAPDNKWGFVTVYAHTYYGVWISQVANGMQSDKIWKRFSDNHGANWSPWSEVTGVGSNQTWTNVTASRAKDTTYTNTTGKAKEVLIATHIFFSTETDYLDITMQGVVISHLAARGGVSALLDLPVTFLVPAGATYSVSGTIAINTWYELS